MKEFFYTLLRRWRTFVIVTLVCLVVGCGGSALYMRNHANQVVTENTATEWMSTEDVYVSSLKYVVYDNKASSKNIAKDAYLIKLYGKDFKQYLYDTCFKQNPDEEMNDAIIGFMGQLVSVESAGLENGFVLETYHYDKETSRKMCDATEQYIVNLEKQIAEQTGEHQIQLLDSFTIESTGATKENLLENIRTYLEETDEISFTKRDQLSKKALVALPILFALLADFCVALYFLLTDALHDRIYSLEKLQERFNLHLVGDFSYMRQKNAIDRFLYRGLVSRTVFSKEAMARLCAHSLEKKYGDAKLVLVGDCAQEKLEALKATLLENGGVDLQIEARSLHNKNAEVMADWKSEEQMLYVAERFKDNTKKIAANLDVCSTFGVDCTGILFI